ncbi:hypothetical protein K7640_15340 [Micromonospora sp. PLK6-60]|uniref:RIP homotypic interaction motif-containing protein n=1 Tax=Micromonospora sp. PLK6-60 TaxID=2873383 RepID=UPI001CA6F087|nr:RIP homotypic interaction motif-containing protein [Micromonospora sp. PLK6-60]MBY8873209.1 hypothetical protein [Micromonospora sp. PLK6-60]
MSRRRVGWGAGAAAVLAAVNSAVINELHAGWPWWIAAVLVTAAGAGLAAGLAVRARAPAAGSGAAPQVGVRDSQGVQVGDGNRQHNTFS